MKPLLTISILLLTFGHVLSQLGVEFGETRSAFVSSIDSIALAEDFNGSIYLLIGDNQVIHRNYGYKSADGNEFIDNHTTFNIGSIAKTICTYVLFLKMKERKINWTEPIRKYLSGLPSWSKNISILDLIEHKSGLPPRVVRSDYTNQNLWNEISGIDTLLAKKFIYSNYNNYLQAKLVEFLTNKNLETVVRGNIFRPTGMTNSHYSRFPPQNDLEESRSYSEEYGDDILNNPRLLHFDLNFGPIYMSMEDLTKWTIFLVNQFDANSAAHEILYSSGSDFGYGPLGKFEIIDGEIEEFESAGQAYNFEVGIFYTKIKNITLVIATNHRKKDQINRLKEYIFEKTE